jgi:hypothetical protein
VVIVYNITHFHLYAYLIKLVLNKIIENVKNKYLDLIIEKIIYVLDKINEVFKL